LYHSTLGLRVIKKKKKNPPGQSSKAPVDRSEIIPFRD